MSLLHYITYKYVIIKDKRLGVAYYIVLALIFLYTIMQVFVNKGYLRYDLAPRGSIRIIVTTPPGKFNRFDSVPEYCCKQENCTECHNLDGLSLNWPVETRAVTIASYMRETYEKQICDQSSYDFAEKHTAFKKKREREYYTVHPENALIKIEHSIIADSGGFSASQRQMIGALVDTNGKVIKKLSSNSVDKIYLKEFLEAANINLSDVSDHVNSNNRTYRKIGVVLHVMIDYRNADKIWFGTGETDYTFHVRHVRLSDFRVKQEIPIVSNNGSICQRVVNKRYGSRLEFQQIGKIGQFCMSNLLMQLVSLMGLLTLTATIIDVFALYLVPDKKLYRQYVYDSSPEFQKVSENLNKEKKE